MGIDSEGATVEGRHRLVVVCAADAWGERLELANPAGVGSLEVFEWLGSVREAWPRHRLAVFSGRYDVAQWCSGVPRYVLEQLWRNGDARWYRHGAAAGPNRVSLRMADGHSFGVWLPGWRSRVRVQDVWGLFQSSFLDALEAWGEPAGELIEWGKTSRGEFSAEDPRLVEYCAAECAALARMMGKVAAKARAVGIRPRTWSGAGVLAGALLSRHEAHGYVRPSKSADVRVAALTAFYGGRVDMFRQGECGRVLALDVRSAYPSVLARAPSMVGRWSSAAEYRAGEPFALWRVKRFESPPLRSLTPLPVRQSRRVVWPAAGAGWYHAVEVAAAIRAGAELELGGGYVFTPARGEPAEPWAWIRELYATREALRAAGDPGERVVKLALNTLYGKLAQSAGEPRFQCFELAGYVTAAVRARMLNVASSAPAEVIGIHTDGLLLELEPGTDPRWLAEAVIDAPVSGELGAWEAHTARNLLIVQPGVYTYDEPGGVAESRRITGRQRGIPQRSLSWAAIEAAWRELGSSGGVRLSREMHHGIGTCAGRRRWGSLGQWVKETREVRFAPSSRFPTPDATGMIRQLPIVWGGDAIPYEPAEQDPDELLRREQPYPEG